MHVSNEALSEWDSCSAQGPRDMLTAGICSTTELQAKTFAEEVASLATIAHVVCDAACNLQQKSVSGEQRLVSMSEKVVELETTLHQSHAHVQHLQNSLRSQLDEFQQTLQVVKKETEQAQTNATVSNHILQC